jgi:hypothetical protein
LDGEIEASIRTLLGAPFVEVPHYSKTRGMGATSSQNPLIITAKASARCFILSGEIEQVAYEKASSIDDRIATFALLGLTGLLITSDDDMAAVVQYRFTLSGPDAGESSQILAVGVATGDPNRISRRILTQRAVVYALVDLVPKLLTAVEKIEGVELMRGNFTPITESEIRDYIFDRYSNAIK